MELIILQRGASVIAEEKKGIHHHRELEQITSKQLFHLKRRSMKHPIG
jgi:hypothetical protein